MKPSIVLESTTTDEDDRNDDKHGQGSNDKVPVAKERPLKKGAVKALNPHEVRWYHKLPKSVSWLPFEGRDSLLIELKWRFSQNMSLGDDFPEKEEALEICENPIVVLDGYYELILDEKLVVKPIYWIGEPLEILRGTWFFEDGLRPLDSQIADAIEEQHLKMFAGQNIPDGPVYNDKSQKPILHSLQLESCRVVWNSIIDVTMHVPKGSSWAHYLRFKSTVFKLRRCYDAEAHLSEGPLPINHLIFVVHGIGQKRQANRIISNTTGMRCISDQALKRSFPDLKYRPIFLPVEWRTCLKLDEDVVEAITPPKVQFIRSLLNSTVLDILYYSSPKYRSEVTDGVITVLNKLYELFVIHNSNFERIGGKISILAHSLGSVICYDVITKWSPLHQYEDYVNDRLNYVIDSPLIGDDSKINLVRLKNARTILNEKEGGLLRLLSTADVNGGLSFQVQNLFCVGSPLSVFLTLRGQTGGKIFLNNPLILYNIFHPMDPVAYRLEPLIHPLYAKYKPLRIHRIDIKDPTPYGDMPMELNKNPPKRKQSKGKSQPIAVASMAQSESNPESDGRTTPDANKLEKKFGTTSWTSLISKFRGESSSSSSNLVATSNNIVASSTGSKEGNVVKAVSNKEDNIVSAGGSSSGSTESLNEPPPVLISQVSDGDPLAQIPPENRLPYRLDYVLKEATLDYELVSALTSHVSYWSHSDVVMFVLSQIYGPKTR